MNFIDETTLLDFTASHGIGAPSQDALPKANQLLFRIARSATVMAVTVALAASNARSGSESSVTVRANHIAAVSWLSTLMTSPMSRQLIGTHRNSSKLVGGAPDGTLPASYFGGFDTSYSRDNGDLFTPVGSSTADYIRPPIHATDAPYWNQVGGDGGDVARAAMTSTMSGGAPGARKPMLTPDVVGSILREVSGRFGMNIRYSSDAKESMRLILNANLHGVLAEIAIDWRRKHTKTKTNTKTNVKVLSGKALSKIADKWVLRLK